MRFLDETGVDVTFDDGFRGADGTRLSANVYRPSTVDRPLRTIVLWTPYDNGRLPRGLRTPLSSQGLTRHCKRLVAAAEMAVVCLDVRGRGDSAGEFVPFRDDAADAAEVVRQVTARSWCEGPVAVMGEGYGALNALGAARLVPDLVGCAYVTSPPGGAWEVFPGRDRVRRADLLLWRHLVAGRTPQPVDLTDWGKVLRLPWAEQEDALGRDDLGWSTWESEADSFSALDESARPVDVPLLVITGWWDPACRASFALAAASPRAELVVGPWTARSARHPARKTGGIDWGPHSVIDPLETQVRWFRAQLTGSRQEPVGRLFITGDNDWISPAGTPGVRPLKLCLTSNGRARTTAGDGRLDAGETTSGSDTFTSLVGDPVPAQPATSPATSAAAPENLDLTFLDGRQDLLVYTTRPLADALLVIGEPVLTLAACSDSPVPALWIVSLEDVFPGGTASVHLGMGVCQAPPSSASATVRIGPIGHRFLAGHSLRVRIGATCTPLYRPADGTPGYDHRTVRHTGSVLTIPVVGSTR